ncbi:MAG: hypothetical protein RIQ56_926 [Candidatus Parcubacteria bacterium]|jgi:hypothetical protein
MKNKSAWLFWTISILSALAFIPIFATIIDATLHKDEPIKDAQMRASVETVQITESQCKDLLTQFYAFVVNKPFDRTELAKHVLEQYFYNAGLPVNRSNPGVVYVLPTSQCGSTLDELLVTITAAQK